MIYMKVKGIKGVGYIPSTRPRKEYNHNELTDNQGKKYPWDKKVSSFENLWSLC